MSADAIKHVVPLGIIGLAIVVILAIYLGSFNKYGQMFAVGVIVLIAGLAIYDKTRSPGTLLPSPDFNQGYSGATGSDGGFSWVYTGTIADWSEEIGHIQKDLRPNIKLE